MSFMGSASSIEKRAPSGMMISFAPHAPGPWAYESAIAWPSAASASRSRCGDRTQRRRGRLLRRLRRGAEPGVLRHLFFLAGGLLVPARRFLSPRGPARRVALAFLSRLRPELEGAAPAIQRDRAVWGGFPEVPPVLCEGWVYPCGSEGAFLRLPTRPRGQRANRVLNARTIDPRLRSVLSEASVGRYRRPR